MTHNIGVVIAIWAPIVLVSRLGSFVMIPILRFAVFDDTMPCVICFQVYFMDTQIWYAIFSSLFGGIHGAFSHLGEVSDKSFFMHE